jgi:hypothetical protein
MDGEECYFVKIAAQLIGFSRMKRGKRRSSNDSTRAVERAASMLFLFSSPSRHERFLVEFGFFLASSSPEGRESHGANSAFHHLVPVARGPGLQAPLGRAAVLHLRARTGPRGVCLPRHGRHALRQGGQQGSARGRSDSGTPSSCVRNRSAAATVAAGTDRSDGSHSRPPLGKTRKRGMARVSC